MTQHTLQHAGGVIIVYKNTSQNKTLHEKIKLKCEGLQLQQIEDMVELDLVDFQIGAGEQKVLIFKPTRGDAYSFGMECSYSIRTE